jgi:plasmid maintenance system killer protein
MKLQQLNAAGDLKDLSIPSSKQLEALKGDRKGEYSRIVGLKRSVVACGSLGPKASNA